MTCKPFNKLGAMVSKDKSLKMLSARVKKLIEDQRVA